MTEEDWTIVLQVFNASRSLRGDKGRDDRKFLEALHYFLVRNLTWRALPEKFGQWNGVWKRFWRLSRSGTFEAFFDALAASASSSDLSASRCASRTSSRRLGQIARHNLHSGDLESGIPGQMKKIGCFRIYPDDGDEGNGRGARRRRHMNYFDRFGSWKQLRIQAVPDFFPFNPDDEVAAEARVHRLISDLDDLRECELLSPRGACRQGRKQYRDADQP
jgi:transposase